MINKRDLIKKINESSANDIGIIESFLSIIQFAVLYNQDGVAINIIKTM